MLHVHPAPLDAPETAAALRDAVWIDLESPAHDEIAAVEQVLAIPLPDAADMVEIEASSRVYRKDGASYMTALLVVGVENHAPTAAPVSFILTPAGRLVTVRYGNPHAFRTARQNISEQAHGNGMGILLWLLELAVDHTADILEQMAAEIDHVSGGVFGQSKQEHHRLSPLALQALLNRIGRIQFTVNKAHEALQTLNRIAIFLNLSEKDDDATPPAHGGELEPAHRDSLKSLSRDIASLLENSAFLMQNVFFLLDAAVGRISIEQNLIIKILSVASVMFLPPTLVASIYGMNFAHMPELSNRLAYPAVLVVMLLSAVLPLLWFRRKGWL